MAGWIAIFNDDGAPVDPGLLCTLLDVPPFGPAQVWSDGPIGVASAPFHRRPDAPLADADRSLLVQGSLAVVFDGRLDDRDSLLLAVERRGDPDVTFTDVELATLAYRKWGAGCARHLLGDFALCIWDGARRSLVGIRDHFGVKPFYLARCGATLIVSNVLRSVRRHPMVSDRLDDRSVGDLLLFGLAMDPRRTMFADISRLPPAHLLVNRSEGVQNIERYWSLQPPATLQYGDDRRRVDEFAAALQRATADRVRGAPIGVLMSGGLDSSSVATMAARALDASAPRTLRAVTGVYDTVAEDEERYYSSLVAATLDIQIDHVPLDGYVLFDRWNSDGLPPEPTAEPMTASTVDMLRRAAAHSAAVLTGDGGDPLLLPTTFIDQIGRVPLARLMSGLWSSMRRRPRPPLGIGSRVRRLRRAGAVEPPAWLGEALRRAADPRQRRIEIEARRTADHGPRSAAFNAISALWWPSTFETYDPGATGQPVAIRYPFFDVRLVQVALDLPSFPFCVNKHVLRETIRGRLPDTIRLRPKTPLAVAPERFHGGWSIDFAVRTLEAAPGIEPYVDVRRFAATVRSEMLFRETETLAAVSLAMWLRYSSGAAALA